MDDDVEQLGSDVDRNTPDESRPWTDIYCLYK